LSYNYQLCRPTITSASSIKDLGVFFHSKLHLHNHVNYVFSEYIKLLGLICSVTYKFYSQECLHAYYMYFTLSQAQVGICLCSMELYHIHRCQ
jgi:hypothetical protein